MNTLDTSGGRGALLLAALLLAPLGRAQQVVIAAETQTHIPPDARPAVPITDAERTSIEISALTLDLHLIPAESRLETHATLTIRNTSSAPISRFTLQLSSTLHWLAASEATPAGLASIVFTQSPVATDADHTAYAQEALFTPAAPLAPNATLTLSVFYAGEIKPNADRLELIGAPHDKALISDWDAIVPTSDTVSTAFRGFGNVLWYPVAAPLARLGNGNQLFDLIRRDRLRNTALTMRLRLTVDYLGDPPDSAVFNGQLQPLAPIPDVSDQLVEVTHGTATADFPAAPIGFRTPSLFLTAQHAVTSPNQLLTAISAQSAISYAAAAASLEPLLTGFLGPTPRTPLLLLDHPGEPFEDAAFLTTPFSSASSETLAPQLIRPLTHAWLSPQSRAIPAAGLWIAEGLPEFMSLAWTERTQGREAAIARLRHASVLIALAEPGASAPAQPLPSASADVFLRLKSAFVLWQLRELLGDDLFSQSLTAFRRSLALNATFDRDPTAFQKTVEKIARRDLSWFFDDWVNRDPGLPDLTIVQANPRPLPGRSGVLVAVEVRNDGDAVADVPVTIRSGSLNASERLRIPAHASASTRIVFEGTPTLVEVNDGSVPELRATTHTFTFNVR